MFFHYIFYILTRGGYLMEVHHHTQMLPADFSHSHSYYEFTFCVEGSYIFHYLLPEENPTAFEKQVTPGMLILLPMCIEHGVRSVHYPYDRYFLGATYEELNSIQGASNTLRPLLHQTNAPKPYFWDLSENITRFVKQFEAMYSAYIDLNIDNAWKQMYLYHYLGLFFCEVNKHNPNYIIRSDSPYTKFIQKAKSYIDDQYSNPITVEKIASVCNLSPNYLSKQFTEQLGISPRQYLTQKRLMMAHKDLCSTILTIQEIAMRNGFGDVNYFIQVFKRIYNITPKQYQKHIFEKLPWA